MIENLGACDSGQRALKLPSDLVRALRERHLLTVVGWGYPDFAPKKGLVREETISIRHRRVIVERRAREETARCWLEAARRRLLPIYEALADSPIDWLVALTPDPYLEITLQQKDSSWVVLAPGQYELPLKHRFVVPLGGSVANPQTMVLTDTELLTLWQTRQAFWEIAESQAARAPLLVLGCDPSETALQNVLGQLRCRPPHARAGWILCARCSANDKVRWGNLGFELILGSPGSLLEEIVRIGNIPTIESSPSPRLPVAPTRPYKHLDFFERGEAGIFFGRAKDTAQLVNMVCAHRLTVVTGGSGVGKTSLLNAGLLSSIDKVFGRAGVYSRCEDDPVAAIGHATASGFGIEPGFRHDLESLTAFLARATANHVLSKRQLTLNALQSWNCDISEKGSAANIGLCL